MDEDVTAATVLRFYPGLTEADCRRCNRPRTLAQLAVGHREALVCRDSESCLDIADALAIEKREGQRVAAKLDEHHREVLTDRS